MTDILRHLPAIERRLATLLGSVESAGDRLNDAALARIRLDLTALLPASYTVGCGVAIDALGNASGSLELLIADRTMPGAPIYAERDRYRVEHLLAAFSLAAAHDERTLAGALDATSSLLALRPVRQTGTSARGRAKPALPWVSVLCRRYGPDLAIAASETLARALHQALSRHAWDRRPDHLWAIEQGLAFRNPRTEGAGLPAEHRTGISRVPELARPRRCYACKQPTARLHVRYERLCSPCGDLHHAKRTQSADLRGRIALVTGGRIGIGHAVALRLLRAGASVIVTTRFPRAAALRFAAEPDAARWGERLRVYGLDLRDIQLVERFSLHLLGTLPHLDVLVNNAAQTVRRPRSFFAAELALEATAHPTLPDLACGMLPGPEWSGARPSTPTGLAPQRASGAAAPLSREGAPGAAALLAASVEMAGDEGVHSWTSQLDQVSAAELVEVQLVNAVAPALLAGRLRPLLARGGVPPTHIVNVSASEGQFAQSKRGVHPHTNMAKAALNMLTHSIASVYFQDGIHVNSVDPGWVSAQLPPDPADAPPPLDAEDGAARICDPIFSAARNGQAPHGVLLKDYGEVPW